MNQQLEEKLIGFAGVVKGWQKESPQLYDEALDEIIAVFKGLPAMQGPETELWTVAEKEVRGALRRQILAELEL